MFFKSIIDGHNTLGPVTSCEHVKVKGTWEVCTTMEACLAPTTLTVNSKKKKKSPNPSLGKTSNKQDFLHDQMCSKIKCLPKIRS